MNNQFDSGFINRKLDAHIENAQSNRGVLLVMPDFAIRGYEITGVRRGHCQTGDCAGQHEVWIITKSNWQCIIRCRSYEEQSELISAIIFAMCVDRSDCEVSQAVVFLSGNYGYPDTRFSIDQVHEITPCFKQIIFTGQLDEDEIKGGVE